MITNLAYEALLKEVELTPKPGLVDKNNNGSHKDMNLETFYKSAKAIKPFINEFVKCKNDFDSLREAGLKCEQAMFKATKGVNTHKGMIFSLAVICGSFASVKNASISSLQEAIQFTCKDLIKNDLQTLDEAKTHGERFYKKTNKAGIREEAQAGYPSVFDKALPFYVEKEKKHGEEMALKLTLLFLMSITEDTTIYARGDLAGLKFVQNEAKKLLHVKNLKALDKKLELFDTIMIEKNLSAGGSADLLAITWFVYKIKETIWKS